MTFGLTSTGFNIKRLSDIQESLNIRARNNVNAQLRTDALSTFGQVRDVFANELADVWEELENVYNSQNPEDADGVALDRTCALNGITRNPPTSSRVLVGIEGDQDFVVLQRTFSIASTINNEEFQNIVDFTIDYLNQTSYALRIDTAADNTDYTATIDGTDVTINSGTFATLATIATSLTGAINASGLDVTALHLQGGDITLTGAYSFSIECTSNIKKYYFAYFDAVNTGEITAIYGTMTDIITPLAEIAETYNFADGVPGSSLESDIGLRIRRDESLSISGSATINAIEARIKDEVDGVTDCKVYENDTDITVDSVPPHSYHIIVIGGIPSEIAQKILDTKSGGIGTYGNTTEQVLDNKGNQHTIKFSVPTDKNIYVIVNVTLLGESEGVFPVTGEADIANAIHAFINSTGIGKDLIQQTLYAPVYSVPGIASVEILIGTAPAPTLTDNIVIAPYEIAKTSLPLITINVV